MNCLKPAVERAVSAPQEDNMKKCIVVSDSFKGTLTSMDICRFSEYVIPKFFPNCKVIAIPVGDGGEGTVDCLLNALDADAEFVEVSGPYMEKVVAKYAVFGDSAMIEMASAAGLSLAKDRKNPMLTTTYGVGELIMDAVNIGCRHIYLGLGASATNDGGCGCCAALGVDFYNSLGKTFIPAGGTLKDICHIDVSKAEEFLDGIDINLMCDVSNPFFGSNGAAYIFGPQKGADPEMVKLLDAGLENLCNVLRVDLGTDIANLQGGAAAGGMGGGLTAMLNGTIKSGIDTILDLTDFERHLDNTDLVITGEGVLDDYSFNGKVLGGITSLTLPREIPVYAIVGKIGELSLDPSEYGISAVFETNMTGRPMEEVVLTAARDYATTLEEAMRYRKLQERTPYRA